MYVEPCCCDKQLPKLLREGKIFFQTNGDVTVEKFMRATGCMVNNGSEMWLMIPSVDVKLLREIKHWFQREWIFGLHLLTSSNQTEIIDKELGDCVSKVKYCFDKMITDGMLSFVGEHDLVAIQGPMLTSVNFSLRMYAGIFGNKAPDGRARAMMEPMMSIMRIKLGIKR